MTDQDDRNTDLIFTAMARMHAVQNYMMLATGIGYVTERNRDAMASLLKSATDDISRLETERA